MAAREVVLPEPVTPVTRTRPLGFSQRVWTMGGSPSWSNERITSGMERKAPAVAPRWLNTLARNRDTPWRPKEKSTSRSSSSRCFCWSVMIP